MLRQIYRDLLLLSFTAAKDHAMKTSKKTPIKIFISRRILPEGLALLQQSGFDLDYWESDVPLKADEFLIRLQRCHGVLSMVNDQLSANVLAACPDLRAIANHAVGLDNIDLNYTQKHHIAVGNTPGVLTQATAELSLALLLAVARRLGACTQEVQSGQWQAWSPMRYLGLELQTKTLGIIGMGRIGERFASICHHALQMPVLYHNRSGAKEINFPARAVSLPELLQQSDIVSLHCDYNASNHHLINRQTLAQMRPGSILLNTTRGGAVDQEALLEFIRNQHLSGAGLDVTTPEPLPAHHPLLGHPNIVITPHIGSATRTTRGRMSQMAAQFLIDFFTSEMA